MKTIEQAIQAASKCLAGVGIENPRLESEFLIAAFLQIPRTHLILHGEQNLSLAEIPKLRGWLRERQKRKPLAYVSGEQPFRDFNLHVTRAVLVPRPETELVVEQAYRCLERFERPVIAVDVGTGSGNIALSLAIHSNTKRVIAIDRSAAALKVAHHNADQIEGAAPMEWIKGNLLAPLLSRRHPRGGGDPSLIVANLPYVTTREMQDLEPELYWEPRMALDGGVDGLRLIEPCIQQAILVLQPHGVLLLEIGAAQSKSVTTLFKKEARWTDIQVFNDFSGLPRIVQARKRGV